MEKCERCGGRLQASKDGRFKPTGHTVGCFYSNRVKHATTPINTVPAAIDRVERSRHLTPSQQEAQKRRQALAKLEAFSEWYHTVFTSSTARVALSPKRAKELLVSGHLRYVYGTTESREVLQAVEILSR